MKDLRDFVSGIVQIAIGVVIGKVIADVCCALLIQRILEN